MSKIKERCPHSFLGLFPHKIVEKAVILGRFRADGKMMFTCLRCDRIWSDEGNSPLPADFREQYSKQICEEMRLIRQKYKQGRI